LADVALGGAIQNFVATSTLPLAYVEAYPIHPYEKMASRTKRNNFGSSSRPLSPSSRLEYTSLDLGCQHSDILIGGVTLITRMELSEPLQRRFQPWSSSQNIGNLIVVQHLVEDRKDLQIIECDASLISRLEFLFTKGGDQHCQSHIRAGSIVSGRLADVCDLREI
jgi:hypothetical protein